MISTLVVEDMILGKDNRSNYLNHTATKPGNKGFFRVYIHTEI